MKLHLLPRMLAALLLIGVATAAVAADCDSLLEPEHTFCTQPALQQLDTDLAAAYGHLATAPEPVFLDWRSATLQQCRQDGECLLNAYLREIARVHQQLSREKPPNRTPVSHGFDGRAMGIAPGVTIQGNTHIRAEQKNATAIAVGKSKPGQQPAAKSPEEIYRIASRSIVLVSAYGKQLKIIDRANHGSGVTIAPGRVATNCHIVRDMDRVVVLFDGSTYSAQVMVEQPGQDVCILGVKDLPSRPVTLVSEALLQPGQKIYAVGNPLNIGLSISDGLVSAIVEPGRIPDIKLASRLIQFNAATWQGNSGGGLFDEQGRLLGMPTLRWQVKDQPPMNFAVPLGSIPAVQRLAGAM